VVNDADLSYGTGQAVRDGAGAVLAAVVDVEDVRGPAQAVEGVAQVADGAAHVDPLLQAEQPDAEGLEVGALVGRLLSGAERVAYRVLLGPMPRFQGVFMVRREALARVRLHSEGRGWAIVMELVARAARSGWRMRSLPTTIRPRRSGVSKVQNVRTIWSNLLQVVALRGRL
jgi:hypothetical protein